jgi:hypothetical protein
MPFIKPQCDEKTLFIAIEIIVIKTSLPFEPASCHSEYGPLPFKPYCQYRCHYNLKSVAFEAPLSKF